MVSAPILPAVARGAVRWGHTCSMHWRRVVATLSAVWLVAACANTLPAVPPRPPTTSLSTIVATPPPGSTTVKAAGCGATPVYRGAVPAWLVTAGGAAGLNDLPYVIARPPIAGGYLFGFPLRAGHPDNPTSKILWAMARPRNGSNLVINAHALGASGPPLTETLPDNSSPGEIYPDIFDVPSAGCWQVTLDWAGHHVVLELDYA